MFEFSLMPDPNYSYNTHAKGFVRFYVLSYSTNARTLSLLCMILLVLQHSTHLRTLPLTLLTVQPLSLRCNSETTSTGITISCQTNRDSSTFTVSCYLDRVRLPSCEFLHHSMDLVLQNIRTIANSETAYNAVRSIEISGLVWIKPHKQT